MAVGNHPKHDGWSVCVLPLYNFFRILFLPCTLLYLIYVSTPTDNSISLLMKQNKGKRRQAVRFKFQHIQRWIDFELLWIKVYLEGLFPEPRPKFERPWAYMAPISLWPALLIPPEINKALSHYALPTKISGPQQKCYRKTVSRGSGNVKPMELRLSVTCLYIIWVFVYFLLFINNRTGSAYLKQNSFFGRIQDHSKN